MLWRISYELELFQNDTKISRQDWQYITTPILPGHDEAFIYVDIIP